MLSLFPQSDERRDHGDNHKPRQQAINRASSRRGFISGAALGTVALLGLAGCAQPEPSQHAKGVRAVESECASARNA
ncbi:MAG: twin-arginine translocation signal domain-containing protein [Collinsella sp.]